VKNYFALQKLVSVGTDTVVHLFFNGERETEEVNPLVRSREGWLKRLDDPTFELGFLRDDCDNPVEQPSFEDQLAHAGWTASPDQIAEWDKRAEKFYRQNLRAAEQSINFVNVPIEELQKRIVADGDDAVSCIYAAKKLIREDAARAAGPHADNFASAAFMLWRLGKIAICTDRDGALGYYQPYVQ
jgi:hypothetical protein